MKRILHALAMLWTWGKGLLRSGFARCEVAFWQNQEVEHNEITINETTNSQKSETASKDKANHHLSKRVIVSEADRDTEALFSLNCEAGLTPTLPRGSLGDPSGIPRVYLGCGFSVMPGDNRGDGTDITAGCAPAFAHRPASKPNIFATLVALVLALFMCLTAAKQVSAQQAEPADAVKWGDIEWESAASSSSDRISAAPQTGDSIPTELWNTPLLLWNGADNSTNTVTLNDYRGKVIILDFWATWCKSCIANMPRMHQLQDQFEDEIVVLPVTYEDTGVASSFLERTADKGMTALRPSFQSIIADSVLKRVFPNPNRTIPYFALIGRDGLFQGPVTPQYLTAHLINQLIEGNADNVPHLRSAPVKPLMDWSISDDNWQPPVSYHTMLSRYMHGAGEPAELKTDSDKGTHWEYYINQPLILLFGIALKSPLPRQANRRIMLVDSAMRFDEHNLRNPAYDPFLYNYCYEAIHPIGTPKEKIRGQLLVDLNTWTGVKGQLVAKRMPCLVIQRKGNIQSAPPRNNEIGWFTLETIAWFLNQRYDIIVPTVLDETGFQGKVWMDDSARKGSIADVREVLRRQGFDLAEEKRDLEMFLLTDSDSEVEVGQLFPYANKIRLCERGGEL